MKEYAFGIDLGGTTAKIGLFTTSGALLEKWEVATDTTNHGENILRNLAKSVEEKMAEKDLTAENVAGVGIGVPGPVMEDRYVPVCANLGGWGDLDVSANLSALLDGMLVKTGNDANMAALGEIWMGTAKGCKNMVLLTLGTGVGGGVIVDGKVICGVHGAGGEVGHITVNRHEDAVCGCGKSGCLEQYSSATGIVRCMKKRLAADAAPCVLRDKDFSAKDVFDAARAGDVLAKAQVEESSDMLGFAMAAIAEVVDPEMFLLGGGVSRAGDILTDAVSSAYKKYAFHGCVDTPIRIASLGNDAGIYGAVRLVKGTSSTEAKAAK
jgi:glucokinase